MSVDVCGLDQTHFVEAVNTAQASEAEEVNMSYTGRGLGRDIIVRRMKLESVVASQGHLAALESWAEFLLSA